MQQMFSRLINSASKKLKPNAMILLSADYLSTKLSAAVLIFSLSVLTVQAKPQNPVVPAPHPKKPPHARPAPEPLHAVVDSTIRPYKRISALSGHLLGVQSDTTVDLVKLWVEEFTKLYPQVDVTVDISGTEAAGPALTDGTADFGLIARRMLISEESPFEKQLGYKPLRIGIAGGSYRTLGFSDALTVFVKKDNPIERLSFTKIDAIYSKTRYRGYKEDITTWGQLGLKGEWADKPILLWGVKPENGFEHILQEIILKGGQWKDGINGGETIFPTPPAVAADRYAIGYAGFGFLKPGDKTLAIAENDNGPYYKGTFAEVVSQKYPLSRMIYIYVNKVPGKPLNPILREFIRFALSKQGQQAVVKDGIFLPLPGEIVKQERAKVQ